MSERDVCRQLVQDFGMAAKLVTDVRKIGFSGTDQLGHFQCFIEVKMGDVLLPLQGIQHEDFRTLKLFDSFRRDGLGVGDIAEVLETKTKDGQLHV